MLEEQKRHLFFFSAWLTLWNSGGPASSCCQLEGLGGWLTERDTGTCTGRERALECAAAGTGSCWTASFASWRASTAFGDATALTGLSGWARTSLHIFVHEALTVYTRVSSGWTVMDTGSSLSCSRRGHQWKDCRLPVLSLRTLLSLWRHHKERKARQLYQPYLRWSRTRSESPLSTAPHMDLWISVLTAFFLLPAGHWKSSSRLNPQQPSVTLQMLSQLPRMWTVRERWVFFCACVRISWFDLAV